MKKILTAVLAVILLGSLGACAQNTPPDAVGLYYEKGMEGYHFDRCINPGGNSYQINDEVAYIPASLRTWNIAPDSVDQTTPITVNSAPEEGQPSGVRVDLWTQTNFTINTLCGDDNKDPSSPVVQFWERVARRYYEADQTEHKTEWWKIMLQNTIVTALETSARSVVRGYQADPLVSGTVREEVQGKIAALFQEEIKRVVGGEYFCGPEFDRVHNPSCGEVKILLKNVDYTNEQVQNARDEKQAQIERASAMLIEAQARLDAANASGNLYDNPGWVEIEKIRLQVEACKANPNGCTIIFDGSATGGVVVGQRS